MPPAPEPQPPSPAPTAALLELLGRRWALRLLWELRDEPKTFGDLRSRLEMSASVLTQRLADLREAALIEPALEGGYALSAQGRSLLAQLDFIEGWASEWARTWGGVGRRERT